MKQVKSFLMRCTMKRVLPVIAIVALVCTSCSSQNAQKAGDVPSKRMYQVATLQALIAGYYYPVCSVGELLKHGDFGLGTFEDLDGEMIVLDGVCYQAKGDGTVTIADTATSTPFAALVTFAPNIECNMTNIPSMDSLKAFLDDKIQPYGNSFVACRIDGVFPKMHVRSEIKQHEPYLPLADVMKIDQREFTYTQVEGTLVGLYCPEYAKEINAAGWHLHFIAKDCKQGGHVMDLAMSEGKAFLDCIRDFSMTLPNDERFEELNLMGRQAEVEAVESGKTK